jgi:hypothetical protein
MGGPIIYLLQPSKTEVQPQENTAHGKMKTQIHSHTSLPFEIDFKQFES